MSDVCMSFKKLRFNSKKLAHGRLLALKQLFCPLHQLLPCRRNTAGPRSYLVQSKSHTPRERLLLGHQPGNRKALNSDDSTTQAASVKLANSLTHNPCLGYICIVRRHALTKLEYHLTKNTKENEGKA